MRIFWLLAALWHFSHFMLEDVFAATTEERLRDVLFPNGTGLASFPFPHGKVFAQIGLSLSQVVDVLETDDAVVLNVVIRQHWHNPDNSWDPTEFDNITKINVLARLVWKPDLYSYANIEDDKNYNGLLDTVKTLITLESDGKHIWNAPIILRLGCGINVKDFPFDTQVCPLKFGSFVYSHRKLKLVPENSSAELSSKTENSEWKLISMKCHEELTFYHRDDDASYYSDIIFELVIQRKPLFLLANLLLPNLMMSFMTPIVFYMPVETGERVQFMVSLILAMALFLTSAFKLMPTSSEVIPFFSYILGTILLAMVLLITCLCYSLSIYYATANLITLPKWLKECILKKLAPQFGIKECCTQSARMSKWKKKAKKLLQASKEINVMSSLPFNHPGRLWTTDEKDVYQLLQEMNCQAKVLGTDEQLSKKGMLVLDSFIRNTLNEEETRENQELWKTVAFVLDELFLRFFCYVYFAILFTLVLRVF